MLICGVLACTVQNPAYEASSAGGSGSEASTSGTDGGGPSGTPGSATDGTTPGATAGGETIDPADTTDETTEGVVFPDGCPEGPMEGVLCHDGFELDLPVGCVPHPVEVADLDGDGFAEILVACDSGSLLRFVGGPSGPERRDVLGHAGDVPRDIAVGALAGAGSLLDIVIANDITDGGVRVFRDVAGMYQFTDLDPGQGPTAVAIGDWDANGAQDIAVTLTVGNQVAFLLANGGGFDLIPTLGVQSEPLDLDFGDFDGDGDDDLAVVSRVGDTLGVYFNEGDPEPLAVFYMQDGGSSPNRVLVNDIELDGTTDILTTQEGFSGLSIYRGIGDGLFPARPEVRPMGSRLRGIDDGDFDGNGLPDAVMADIDQNTLFFLMLIEIVKEGDDIVEQVPVDIGGVPRDLSAGDIDGDGLTDVVVSLENDRVEVVLSGL